jgi:hypothetical protein
MFSYSEHAKHFTSERYMRSHSWALSILEKEQGEEHIKSIKAFLV